MVLLRVIGKWRKRGKPIEVKSNQIVVKSSGIKWSLRCTVLTLCIYNFYKILLETLS